MSKKEKWVKWLVLGCILFTVVVFTGFFTFGVNQLKDRLCGEGQTAASTVLLENLQKMEDITARKQEERIAKLEAEKAAAEQAAAEEAARIAAEEAAAAEAVAAQPKIEGEIALDPTWVNADMSQINTGTAVLYRAVENNRGIVIGLNAGHGTQGGEDYQTPCHPDNTPKVTGGSTAEGALTATAVSGGMQFSDGVPESEATLRLAQILRDKLLEAGFDVLMLRDGEDVQLDNIARTVICNYGSNCHISLHWDSDGQEMDKGCFYASVPEELKYLDNVAAIWQESDRLGTCLIGGLQNAGRPVFGEGSVPIDLTQTSFSTVPSVDIELGNQCSDHSPEALEQSADGLLAGIKQFYGVE